MASQTLPAGERSYRITSIDALRGLIVIIMALDHVRDFLHIHASDDPTSDPHVGAILFFTRWITHFCAPNFCFLAGVSAGLMRQRKPPVELASFLAKRGLWLLFVEIFIISFAITLWPIAPQKVILLQTLTAIGGSMIALAAAQFAGPRACLAIGLAIICGHNLLDPIWPDGSRFSGNLVGTTGTMPLWVGLHSLGVVAAGPVQFFVAYPLLPWIGVMLAGFGCAPFFEAAPATRIAWLQRTGLAVIALFLVLRGLDIYGDARHWHKPAEDTARVVMNFLNTTKYPPSLQYLCMTLGPAALICAAAEKWRGPIFEFLLIFGRVPFAFYVAHFWLIRIISLGVAYAQGAPVPAESHSFGFTLPYIYLVWICVIAALYPLCRYMAGLKSRRRDWWLSYL